MSSPTDSAAATTAATAAADSSSRKVPPPCWTTEETVELIKAYREKWFAANRGNLRAADWDAVAATLADSPSSSDPPKTVVQCRHKIEKIRKRYRGEKLRCLKFPGRFFSSWDLFPLLDAMEIGSIGSKQEQDDSSPVVAVADKASDGLDPDLDFDPDAAFRARKFSRMNNNSYNSHSYINGGFDESHEFAQNSVNVALMPKGYSRSDRKPKRLSQMDDSMLSRDERYRPGKRAIDEWGNNHNNNNISSSSRIRVKNPSTSSRSFDQFANGNANAKMNGGGGVSSGNNSSGKGSRDPVAEVVSAIKMLREGFVMVEEMKMDMAVEIEKMRMGMELKHNQMLVEMQQDIVDAFAKACSKKNKKNKNKKKKVDTSSMPDLHRNCESGIAAAATAGFETTTD